MATPDLDAPRLSSSDVAGKRFRSVRRGYDPEEVHEFLRVVAERIAQLQGEIEWQRARGEHLERRRAAAQEAAYVRLSREFLEVVRKADEAAGRVRLQAEVGAQAELAAARAEAERILARARADADRVLSEARANAAGDPIQGPRAGDPLAALEADFSIDEFGMGSLWDRSGPDRAPQLFEDSPATDWPAAEPPMPDGDHPEPIPPELEELDFELNASLFDFFDDQD